MSNPDNEFGLVMPFVTVTSKGGPHDDDAYVCGYEMGLLDATLRNLPDEATVTQNLHAANKAQADLLAMQHGCTLVTAMHDDPIFHEWIVGTFAKTRDAQ